MASKVVLHKLSLHFWVFALIFVVVVMLRHFSLLLVLVGGGRPPFTITTAPLSLCIATRSFCRFYALFLAEKSTLLDSSKLPQPPSIDTQTIFAMLPAADPLTLISSLFYFWTKNL